VLDDAEDGFDRGLALGVAGLARARAAGALGTGLALGLLARVLDLLGLEARLRAGFHPLLGDGNDVQTLLASL